MSNNLAHAILTLLSHTKKTNEDCSSDSAGDCGLSREYDKIHPTFPCLKTTQLPP